MEERKAIWMLEAIYKKVAKKWVVFFPQKTMFYFFLENWSRAKNLLGLFQFKGVELYKFILFLRINKSYIMNIGFC